MNLGWFLIPALGGYWFLKNYNGTRYGILRESGYHVFFRAAFVGGLLAAVARLIDLFLNWSVPCSIEFIESYAPFPYSSTAILSVLLAVSLPYVLNRRYSKNKAAHQIARDSGDLVELLIAESIQQRKLVELSLRSGKSYIGLARESGIMSHGESDIALVPIISGYRHKDTQELKITFNYAPMIRKSLNNQSTASKLQFDDFQIIIPMAEIISARIFDLDVYENSQKDLQQAP